MGIRMMGPARSHLTKSFSSFFNARGNYCRLRAKLVLWYKRKQMAGFFSISWNLLEPFMCAISIYIHISFDRLGYCRLCMYTYDLLTFLDSNLGRRTATEKGLSAIHCSLALTKWVTLPRKSWVWTCDIALWSFMMPEVQTYYQYMLELQ